MQLCNVRPVGFISPRTMSFFMQTSLETETCLLLIADFSKSTWSLPLFIWARVIGPTASSIFIF